MRYVDSLVSGNMKSLSDLLKSAFSGGFVTEKDIKSALEAESSPLPPDANIHQLTLDSEALIAKIMKSPDRDMLIIVKKILKSTRYAVATYYSVISGDNKYAPASDAAVASAAGS